MCIFLLALILLIVKSKTDYSMGPGNRNVNGSMVLPKHDIPLVPVALFSSVGLSTKSVSISLCFRIARTHQFLGASDPKFPKNGVNITISYFFLNVTYFVDSKSWRWK